MLKRKLFALITGISLMIAVAGASGIVADSLGFEMTTEAHACSGSGGGGNC